MNARLRFSLLLLARLLLFSIQAWAAVPAEIHLTVEGSDAVEAERLRQAIAAEASTRVVVAPGGAARVRVRRFPGRVVVVFTGPDGRRLSREVALPADPVRAREAIVLLVGNLVRDEAADLEAALRPPAASSAPLTLAPVGAPPATSAAPSPAPSVSSAAASVRPAPIGSAWPASSSPAAPAGSDPPPAPFSPDSPPLSTASIQDAPTPAERPFRCAAPGPLYPVAVEAAAGLTAPPGATRPDSRRWLSVSLIGEGGGSLQGLSLGLLGEYGRRVVCGVQLGVLLAQSEDVGGFQFATFSLAGRVRGWQHGVVALADSVDGVQTGVVMASRRARGAQFGTLLLTWSMTGLQLGVGNLAGTLDGAQLGVGNVAGHAHGTQVSAVNVAGDLRGLQLGAINVVGELRGLQLGTVNVARRVDGLQLGLVNVASESDAPIGLINVIQHGRTHVDVSALDYPGAAVSLVHGGRHTHAIQGLGVRWTRDGQARPVALVGLGVHLPLGGPLFGELDVLTHFLPGPGFRRNATVNQLRLLVGLRVTRSVSVFAGPTVSVSANQLDADEPFSLQPSWTLTHSDHTPTVVRLWPGLTAGTRLF